MQRHDIPLLTYYHCCVKPNVPFAAWWKSARDVQAANLSKQQVEFLVWSNRHSRVMGKYTHSSSRALHVITELLFFPNFGPDFDELHDFLANEKQTRNTTAPFSQDILDKNAFHHEYYFISQLFDDQWNIPTATIASIQA